MGPGLPDCWLSCLASLSLGSWGHYSTVITNVLKYLASLWLQFPVPYQVENETLKESQEAAESLAKEQAIEKSEEDEATCLALKDQTSLHKVILTCEIQNCRDMMPLTNFKEFGYRLKVGLNRDSLSNYRNLGLASCPSHSHCSTISIHPTTLQTWNT